MFSPISHFFFVGINILRSLLAHHKLVSNTFLVAPFPWWQALELRMRLIPVSQKVLLCSAWVDSGEYLAATARLVAQCQAEVFGIACVRFEQNRRYGIVLCLCAPCFCFGWTWECCLRGRGTVVNTSLCLNTSKDTCVPRLLGSGPRALCLFPVGCITARAHHAPPRLFLCHCIVCRTTLGWS